MKYNILYIVDHHLPTEEIIPFIKSPNFIYFDKLKCGALNLWNLIHPNDKPPLLLEYVNDRDLWLNILPNYQEVFNGLTLEAKTVENWYDLLFTTSKTKFQNILDKGIILRQKVSEDLKYLEKKSYIKEFIFDNKIYNVVYCNSSLYQSDLGNYLITKFNVDFAAIYHYSQNNKTIFSLRGNNKVNLSVIAKSYGGGGHFNAAGFSINGITEKLM